MSGYWFIMCNFFFCMSLWGECSLWLATAESIENKEQFHTLCMDTWTRIDLVQAIGTAKGQKKMILSELIRDLTVIAASLEKVVAVEERYFYKKLIQSMHFSFLNAFPLCKNQLYKRCMLLFATMITRLKSPVDLKADSAS